MRSAILLCQLVLFGLSSALLVGRPAHLPLLVARRVCPPLRARADPSEALSRRVVRVHVPNAELMAATVEQAVQKKKGIYSIAIGGREYIQFSHDMTNTFRWLAVILGLVLVKVIRAGSIGVLFADEEPNWKHIARSKAEEAEQHEFCCERCGYTLFPARGREGKFFPDSFTCPNPTCNAPKEAFFDMTDLSDARTLKALEEDEDFDYEIEEIEVSLEQDEPESAAPSKPKFGGLLGPKGKGASSAPPPEPKPKPSTKARAAPPAAPPRAAPPPAAPPRAAPPPAAPPAADTDDFDPLNNPLL